MGIRLMRDVARTVLSNILIERVELTDDTVFHLVRLKVFAKVLNQDFNDFQFTRLNNLLAHGLGSLGRIPPYS
jgi:hypothetical protein